MRNLWIFKRCHIKTKMVHMNLKRTWLRIVFVRKRRLQFGLASCFGLCFVFVGMIHLLQLIPSGHRSTAQNDVQKIVKEIHNNGFSVKRKVNPMAPNYIREPIRVCNDFGSSLLLLILVKSDVLNIVHRTAIRNTWGSINDPSIQLLFLVGYNSNISDVLNFEVKTHADILQGEFKDTYRNNLNKTVMAYKWAVENCYRTNFLFFVDDDFFVNIKNIVHFLQSKPYLYTETLLTGHLILNGMPDRNNISRHFLSYEEYPFNNYPPYLAGGAIIVSMKTAKLLKTAFPYVPYIHIDDVYLGIVAEQLRITPTEDCRFENVYTPPYLLKNIFASHSYGSSESLLEAWDIFISQPMSSTFVSDDYCNFHISQGILLSTTHTLLRLLGMFM